MSHYQKSKWIEFRKQVIELDNFACTKCGSSEDSKTLQVHHKHYLAGRLPWEYSFGDCETLCKGCHAAEHGIIRPKDGWELICEDDLGDLIGECEHCGTSIRYTFLIFHPKWGVIEVGTFCCDGLTGTALGSQQRKIAARRKRFLKSPRWQQDGYGRIKIALLSAQAAIDLQDGDYHIEIEGRLGKKCFSTIEEAKNELFTIANDGSLASYLLKKKNSSSK